MVYFSCSGCNESLKKPKVVKHLSFCRRCHILTCLDCQKDFTPQSYVTHTQCVSELEKYSGRNYVEPANANKGQKKQLSWMDSVRAAVELYPKLNPLDSRERTQVHKLLSSLLRFDNIPRKKAKFENFVKSAIGQFRRDQAAIDGAWTAISTPPPSQEPAEESSKKRKLDEVEEEEENEKENDKEEKPKKRKKEREEKETEEESEDTDQSPPPKKKKKKKKEEDNEENDEELSKPKKKKKKKEEKEDDEEEEEEEEQVRKPKKKRQKENGEHSAEVEEVVPEQAEAIKEQKEEEASDSKFVLSTFIADLLQAKDGAGISFSKLEKRAVKAYIRSFSRPNKEPRPERVKQKLKLVVAKHFREIDGRVFERKEN